MYWVCVYAFTSDVYEYVDVFVYVCVRPRAYVRNSISVCESRVDTQV